MFKIIDINLKFFKSILESRNELNCCELTNSDYKIKLKKQRQTDNFSGIINIDYTNRDVIGDNKLYNNCEDRKNYKQIFQDEHVNLEILKKELNELEQLMYKS